MAKQNGKGGHKHDWQQSAVTLQQKGGRVAGVVVRWQCAGRKCKAETVTQAVVRKPSANARPKAENPGYSAAEVRGMVQRGKERNREMGRGSLAAMEAEPDLDDLTAEDFVPPAGESKRTGNAAERRNAFEFYLPTLGDILQDPAQARQLGV